MSSFDLLAMNRQMTNNPMYVYNTDGDRTDVSDQPMIDPMLMDEMILNEVTRTGKAFDMYVYNGIKVPRVTSILEYCFGNREYLMRWAAKLGPDYISEKQKSLDIGSKLHEAIAEYLMNGTTYTIEHLRGSIRNEVRNSFRNFLSWYNHIKAIGWKLEIIASEVPLICPWFGGTTDLICIVNERRYVLDFKSSKSITDDYIIQVSAYKWIIDNYYYQTFGHMDGVGILRFDKSSNTYEDIFFDESDPLDAQLIDRCQRTFGTALNMFYAMNTTSNMISLVKKTKNNNKGRLRRKIS